MLLNHHTAAVNRDFTIGQHGRSEHNVKNRLVEMLWIFVFVNQLYKIVNVCVERGSACNAVVERLIYIVAAAIVKIALGSVFNDILVAHLDAGIIHAEHVENTLLCKLIERLAGDFADDFSAECEIGVGIEIFALRSKVKLLLCGDNLEQVILCDDVVDSCAAHHKKLPLVADAADVIHTLTYCDRSIKCDIFRQISADIGIKVNLALIPENEKGHNCNLLGNRRHVENGILCHVDVVLEHSLAEAGIIDDFALVTDENLPTRSIFSLPELEYI